MLHQQILLAIRFSGQMSAGSPHGVRVSRTSSLTVSRLQKVYLRRENNGKSTPCGPQSVCYAGGHVLLSSPAHPVLETRHWRREDLSSVERTGFSFPILFQGCATVERRCCWTPQRTGKTHLLHSKNAYYTLGTLSTSTTEEV